MQSGFHREAIKNKQLRYGTRGGARICTIVEEIVFACPTAHLTRRTSHSTPTAILPADCCQQIARTRSGATSIMSWVGRKDSPPTSGFSNIYFYQGSSLFVPVDSNNEQLGTGPGVRAGRQGTDYGFGGGLGRPPTPMSRFNERAIEPRRRKRARLPFCRGESLIVGPRAGPRPPRA